MQNKNTKNIVFAALFTAIITIISQIHIHTPFDVPVTLQTFAIALCGFILGAKWSVCSVTVYILAGAVGLPVFCCFRGGIQQIFSLNGGFIIGFIFLALFCGISLKKRGKAVKLGISYVGLFICHLLGVIQFAIISKVGFLAAFLTASLPFLIKDMVLIALALYIAPKLENIITKSTK